MRLIDLGYTKPVQVSLRGHLRASDLPVWKYPWTGIEAVIEQSAFDLIGYGSLLNTTSARRTLSADMVAASKPVLAYGGHRIFNYVMPDAVLARRGWPEDPKAIAALNVVASHTTAAFFNGRCFTLTVNDIPGLRERERGYDLVPVSYIDWSQPDSPARLAYALMATCTQVDGESRVHNEVLPNPGYVDLCESGAESVSPEFLQLFRDSSWVNIIAREKLSFMTLEAYQAMSPDSDGGG